MYRLIIELPFDILGIWYKLFENEHDALEKKNSLPYGMIIIPDNDLISTSVGKLQIILPFDRELETNDA